MPLSHTATAVAVAALTLAGVAAGANFRTHAQTHAAYARAGADAMPMVAASVSAPAASTYQLHRFRGRVTSASPARHSFWMRTATNGSIHIYTSTRTYWDDCGWGYMRTGYRLDVRAYRSHGHWMAARMQSWGHGMMQGWH